MTQRQWASIQHSQVWGKLDSGPVKNLKGSGICKVHDQVKLKVDTIIKKWMRRVQYQYAYYFRLEQKYTEIMRYGYEYGMEYGYVVRTVYGSGNVPKRVDVFQRTYSSTDYIYWYALNVFPCFPLLVARCVMIYLPQEVVIPSLNVLPVCSIQFQLPVCSIQLPVCSIQFQFGSVWRKQIDLTAI